PHRMTPLISTPREPRAARIVRAAAGLLLAWAAVGGGPSWRVAAADDVAGPPTPEEALQAYRKGRFTDSEGQYAELAKERPNDPRLRFNAGTAAYRQNDLTNAARWFESVVAAPDLRLQQQAYYNLGNTRYRLGEGVENPQDRQRLWQEAITNFTAASKLDATDTNAAGNLAFLRQKLEELQQQMPPPSQQPQENQKDQNKDSKKDESKEQEQQQGQDKDSSGDGSQGQSQGKPGSSKDSQEKESKPESSQGKDQEKSQESGKPKPEPGEPQSAKDGANQDGKEPQSAASGQEGAAPGEGQEATAQEASESKEGEMTKAQAVRLLEGQKGDEKALMLRAHGGGKEADRVSRVRKPW
ncbi:MAG: hypothetical protein RIS76_726, partial [Verrucomicrobiota bacterium]